jgi:hypothetical protein
LTISAGVHHCFVSAVLNVLKCSRRQLRIHVPGSELLETLFMVGSFLTIFIGQADAAGAEAADGAGGRDQSWHSVKGV